MFKDKLKKFIGLNSKSGNENSEENLENDITEKHVEGNDTIKNNINENNINEKNIKGKDNMQNKKKLENLIFLAIVLIITIIAINFIWNDDKNKEEINSKNSIQNGKILADVENTTEENETVEESSLEKSLENILEKIQGVGEVNVFINYSESSEVVAMYNENSKTSTTEETDTEGGVRKIQETDTQKDVIYQENDGEKVPITQKTIKPKIEGAIITAKGASDANVKTNIIQAVEAVTGLATHKIQVFEMK